MQLPQQVVEGVGTVSDKVRALDAAGYPRAEIARILGKRYQHVRNVLEADKAKAAGAARPAGEGAQALASRSERAMTERRGDVLRMQLGEGGVVQLPDDLCREFDFQPGDILIGRIEQERLVIYSHRENMRLLRASLPSRDPSLPSLSEELIAERREAAARGD